MTKNGKSTLLNAIRYFLGYENCESIKLHQLKPDKTFEVGKLHGKIANFDLDCDKTIIKGDNMAMLKSLIENNCRMQINAKFKDIFNANINVKIWCASNFEMKTQQRGPEWTNRVIFLRMNRNNILTTDWELSKKLENQECTAYLLWLSYLGYQRLIKMVEKKVEEPFIKSETSNKELRQFLIENNSAVAFIFNQRLKIEKIDDLAVKTLYKDYKTYCNDEDIAWPMKKSEFEAEICNYFEGLEIEFEDNERIFKIKKPQ